MKPTADSSPPTAGLPLRTLLFVSLVLLLSLLLAGVFEYLRLQERANEQAAEVSRAFGRSSAILIQPLVLSDDRISLNYLLNELARQPLINGLRLTAPDQTLVALAGDPQGRSHTLELVQSEVPIGQLTIWSNADSFSAPLQAQLIEIALLLAFCFSISLGLVLFSLRRYWGEAPSHEPSFAEVQAAYEQPQDSDRIPDFRFDQGRPADDDSKTRLDALLSSDLDESTPAPEAPASRVTPAPQMPTEATAAADTSVQPEEPTPCEPQPAPAPHRVDTDALGVQHPSSPDHLDTGDLVSLLKPEPGTAPIPRFTPRTPGADPLEEDGDEMLVPDLGSAREDDFSFDELDTPPSSARPNPLQQAEETPTGVYAFEQDLELMLTPDEAGYLLLIDTRSAHSDNLDEEEREPLLRNYRTLANSAARIYNGAISTLKDGNLRILFTDGDDKDSHGINAVCCAMLFTWLYKQYNQQQIRAFRPVMNLHMALVRGAAERTDFLLEEANFLARTTQSNELISHTALTEAPLLKEMLLEKADIRREDEDKVLILSINDAYQNLLEKQAEHLLNKLNEKNTR